MIPLYAARIEDLGPGDFVQVECAGCGHEITRSALLQELRFNRRTWCSIWSRAPLPRVAMRAGRRSCR
jgi:hypothetical protein